MSILIKEVQLEGKTQDLLISQGKIAEIAPSIMAPEAKLLSGKDCAILPGLVNSHTHSAMTLLRGYGDDMPLFPWLQQKIWPAEARYDDEAFYWGYRLAFLEMIRSGTVFFNDMYFQGDIALKALKDSGLRGAINYVFLNTQGTNEKEQWEDCEKWFENIAQKDLETFCGLAPHSVYSVPENTLKWIGDFARERSLKIHIHLSDTEKENLDCIQHHGKSPTARLKDLGLMGPNLSVAHGLWLNEKDINILSENQVPVVYNPSSNMKLASGAALDFTSLKEAEIPLLLGTDGCSSNNNLDLFEEMKIAALLQKQHYQDPTRLTAREIFYMASTAGADYWNTGGGVIKVGATADLMLIRLDLPEMVPCHDLISNLVYAASGNVVDSLLVKGELLMHQRQVKDQGLILEQASIQAKRICE
jgi:5-methylthioadenosine/S-adenosylhomocysteine deaminase